MKYPIGLTGVSGHICPLANPGGSSHGPGAANGSFARCRSQNITVLREGDIVQCNAPLSACIKSGASRVRIAGVPIALANKSQTDHQSKLQGGSSRVFVNE